MSRSQPSFWAFLRDRYLWITILLTLPVTAPLLQPGYYWGGHDARHSVYFLYQFYEVFQDGIWYPRWAPDFAFGYGYPFFNIYGPLSSYAGQLFHVAGLDIVTSVKAVFGLSAILSGVAMYAFVRRILGAPAGMIAALTYVYIPYHLFDLYVRAALAESVGFVFVPLTLWGFYESVTRPRLIVLICAGLAYAGLMFTSNLLALLFTPILGLFVAVMILWQLFQPAESDPTDYFNLPLPAWLQNNRLARAVLSGLPPTAVLLLGLGLSAVFWLPAILEYPYVRVDQWIGGRFAFGDDFVEVFQLFSSKWGFGASVPGPNDDAGFQIGLAALVLYVISVLVVPKLPAAATRRTLIFYQVSTIVLIFLTTPASYLVWQTLPLSTFAQFPWRLLVIIAPLISITAGAVVALPAAAENDAGEGNVSSKVIPIIALSALILLASYPYLQAEVRDPKPTEGPVSQAALFRFQQSSDEMTGQTAWVQRIPNWSSLAEQVERGGEITTKVNYAALPQDQSVGVYSMEMGTAHELLWVGAADDGHFVTFFIPFYPGWRAVIYEDLGPHDGNLDRSKGPVTRIGPIVDSPQIQTTAIEGWMKIPIPAGSHFLELRFEDTPVRKIGWLISTFSIFGIILLTGYSLIRIRWPKKPNNLPETKK
jgi:hypothetical protein